MIGSVAADPLMTGVDRGNKSFIAAVTDLPLLSSLLVHSWAAFGAIKGDVCSALRYLISETILFLYHSINANCRFNGGVRQWISSILQRHF